MCECDWEKQKKPTQIAGTFFNLHFPRKAKPFLSFERSQSESAGHFPKKIDRCQNVV